MVVGAVPCSRRVVKPAACAMAVAIPTSRECFLQARQSEGADFAKRFLGGWEQYHAQLVSDLEELERMARDWGVTLARDATLDGFAELLRAHFEAVILIAHWSPGAVEFSDGMAPIGAVADRVPVAFSGVLDLCVCHPADLVRKLHVSRPGCLVKHLSCEAAPPYWFQFYKILFRELHDRDLTYVEAIAEVAGRFLDWAVAGGS